MAKDNKFGTFGGVYTPSLLTILGVIMYLRLPWVAGHSGMVGIIGIILVAHVISIATGLSISSIATDKNVGAGGPYYIVSRSLGLPIGGALGLALFTGLCFSTSLYVIGLCESVLSTMGIEATPNAIRIAGTIALLVITAVTVISTSFAIKTQYLVFALILVSLFAIFFGDPSKATPGEATNESPSIALLFGIFFPAVTGFTAGVNMSGDLKDPKSAIPRGTMLAIASGLIVYMGMAVFLIARVGPDILRTQPDVLLQIAAVSPWLVILGIWGATFSSGLGSIMGAPRILQALSVDRITPALFAKGHGPTLEPRNALVLSVLIAEAGILIAELNAIARIVSMVFLTMYAFLNISCAIEAKVSPDFRPAFRIPVLVSIIGAVTCIVIMIQLDLIAMLGATALMVVLYVVLQRRQLELDAGDAWQGVWSALIRTGLYRVTGSTPKQQRNWRPNIVAFRTSSEAGTRYEDFAEALITGNGILTDFEIAGGGALSGHRGHDALYELKSEQLRLREPTIKPTDDKSVESAKEAVAKGTDSKKRSDHERSVGLFRRRLYIEGSPFDEIAAVCRHFGFSGLEPNTLLLPHAIHRVEPGEFISTIDQAADQDLNILLYKPVPLSKKAERIDVWWQVDQGNIAFSLALLRFITRASSWERAGLRFILISSDSAHNDNLRSTMRRLLREHRINADIKLETDTFGEKNFAERIRSLSADASLTMIGLPNESGALTREFLLESDEISDKLGNVLWIRGGSAFPEVLPTGRAATISELPPAADTDGSLAEVPALDIPDVPDIKTTVGEFSDAYQRLVGRLSDQCLSKIYGRHVELVRQIRKAAARHLDPQVVEKAGNPKKRRTAFNRLQSSFLLECKTALLTFGHQELQDLRSIFEGSIDSFIHDERALGQLSEQRFITRPKSDFLPQKGDSRRTLSFKRRRRLLAFITRREPSYRVPVGHLKRYYFGKAISRLLDPTLRSLSTDCHQLIIHVGKLLNSSRARNQETEVEDLSLMLATQREQLLRHLDDLDTRAKDLLRKRRWTLISSALELAQEYGDDVSSFDLGARLPKERPIPLRLSSEVDELPTIWAKYQQRLATHAELALALSGVQHRANAIFMRGRQAVEIGLSTGAQRQIERAIAALNRIKDLATKTEDAPNPGERLLSTPSLGSLLTIDSRAQFNVQTVIASLTQEYAGIADELPQEISTLSDESVQALEEGREAILEDITLPVRSLVQFFIEHELITGIQNDLSDIVRTEQRSLGIAQDVARIINFQLGELDTDDEEGRAELVEQLVSAISSSLDRLNKEQASLLELRKNTLQKLDERLHVVTEATNAYELSLAAHRLEQHLRVNQGLRAMSGAQGALRRGLSWMRDGVARLIYQRSEAAVMAAKNRSHVPDADKAVDRVASLVQSLTVRPDIASALPYFYRQLFSGQSSVNESFWVGRQAHLDKAKYALKQFDAGRSGCIVVTGPRLSGKSALLQKLASEVFDKKRVYRVHSSPGGSTDPAQFDKALAKSMGQDLGLGEASTKDLLSTLPHSSVVMVDELSLWWERGEAGTLVIEQILRAIDEHRGRVLFVLGVGSHCYKMMNRFVPLADSALALLECDALSAGQLQKIITYRHGSTGLAFSYKGKIEDELTAVAKAQLFSAHFDLTGGRVGAALRSWLSSIERIKGDTIEVRQPTKRDWEAIDSLAPHWVAIVIQLLLHKQLSMDRLTRLCQVSAEKMKDQLDPLLRMGLVLESQRRVIELEPNLELVIHERFVKKGYLA